MLESKSSQLRPAYQIGSCLVLIVVVRLYYAWIESQTYWLYPQFAERPAMSIAVYVGLVPIVSLIAAIAAYRYFSPVLTIPFAAVGGGTAGLIVNSIPGAVIGACIGCIVYSGTLRRWIVSGASIFLRFDLPAFLWGTWFGSIATSLFVRTNERATLFQIVLLIVFFVGLATLLILAVRTYQERRGRLIHAIAGCILASGLGLAVGPMANTLYRIYALNQVGDVAWDPMPQFEDLSQGTWNLWYVHGVVLNGEATDAHLRLLQGLPSITSVYIRDAKLSDDAVAEVLGNRPNLELLEFRNVPLSDNAFSTLQRSTRLRHLTLTEAEITDETFAHLAPIPTLQSLEVDGVEMRGNGLRKLARSGRLRYLVIEDTPLTDDHLAELNGLQGLTTLRLDGTKITGSGLKDTNLPWLNNLSLLNSPIEDRYLADLNSTALKFLYLDGISLSEVGATAIAGMTSLVGLSLRRADVTDAQLQILGRLPTTTQLSLDGRKLTPNATDKLVAEDISILIDDAKITVDDIERLIAIGHEVHLTDCQLDEASIERLASHNMDPHFVIRVQEYDKQMTERLSGGSVQVIRYWPN